ncbi:hypothetical protein GE061_019911 [Apolygus lucorum]|uniref:Uncharacterized protein n=1 Tax=Apolygus lucorum TaxID=248454 RepID=A0A6A4JIS9_APOLU|nr:hypothetical protein GE061_019911 [Apolygus lucorum]
MLGSAFGEDCTWTEAYDMIDEIILNSNALIVQNYPEGIVMEAPNVRGYLWFLKPLPFLVHHDATNGSMTFTNGFRLDSVSAFAYDEGGNCTPRNWEVKLSVESHNFESTVILTYENMSVEFLFWKTQGKLIVSFSPIITVLEYEDTIHCGLASVTPDIRIMDYHIQFADSLIWSWFLHLTTLKDLVIQLSAELLPSVVDKYVVEPWCDKYHK